jgi:hypothetical protein
VTFEHGGLFERSFETPAGWVDVLAEVVVAGRRLELRDMAVYPRSAARLDVSLTLLMRWARGALDEVRQAGFTEVRVTATRLSGASPGRRVDLVIPLDAEQEP